MKDLFKMIFMYAIRFVLVPLKLLPIKQNYVMFCVNSGKGYFCNPKYIYQYLQREKVLSNIKYIWCVDNVKKYRYLKNDNTIICKYRSLYFYYLKIVSKIYISNSIEGNEIPKKKEQVRIQTWHGGGCYKKVALSEKGKGKAYKKRTEDNINKTDLFISSSKVFSEIIRDNFEYKGRILECGMPRNDILFQKEKHIAIREKVLKHYNISDDTFLVLYAPTWRYDESKLKRIDFSELKKCFEKKFKKNVTILYRSHFHMKKMNDVNIIEVSDYEDMQELLIASDSLISDYSSSIWDYSFLYKPCFLFCPDLLYYIEKRGFVIDIFKWGFPISQCNDELIKNIDTFDCNKFRNNMEEHHKMLESYETGNASRKIADFIKEKVSEIK